MPSIVIVVLGCCAVLILDTLGSLASRRLGFSYTLLAPVSLVLYATAGFFAARAGDTWLLGSLAGAAAGATDATIGWRISRALGADPVDDVTPGVELGTATAVTIGGAIVGTLAGLAA